MHIQIGTENIRAYICVRMEAWWLRIPVCLRSYVFLCVLACVWESVTNALVIQIVKFITIL